MKINKLLLTAFALTTLLVSCQKEVDLQDLNNPGGGGNNGGGNNGSIQGTWKFVGMDGVLSQELKAGTGVDEEKILTSYAFTSFNNKGTVTIDASNFISSGIGYSIDTTVHTEFYIGGDLLDSLDTDFQFDTPLSSGSVKYRAVGSDSIYLDQGFITLDPSAGGGDPMATIPAGYKIEWSGDTLILKTRVIDKHTEITNGVTAYVSNDVAQVVKLKK